MNQDDQAIIANYIARYKREDEYFLTTLKNTIRENLCTKDDSFKIYTEGRSPHKTGEKVNLFDSDAITVTCVYVNNSSYKPSAMYLVAPSGLN